MTWGTLQERYTNLCMCVMLARYQYYVLTHPTLSDAEYDQLEDQLRVMEAEHPEIVHPKSPILIPGSEVAADYPRSIRDFASRNN
jgi:DNA ligase (NAD+)